MTDDPQIWHLIDDHRTAVADLLESLTPAEWDQPSLCAGWTVRDVAAHITLQQQGLRDLPAMLRAFRGTIDRTIAQAARHRAATHSPAALIAEIRAMVGVRRPNLSVTYLETLIDILVHAQDIALPLHRHLDMPPAGAAVATTRVLSMRWPPPPPGARRAARNHLIATDIDWSFGTGPEIRGPIAALLLVSTGRLTALPQLTGPGTATLTATK